MKNRFRNGLIAASVITLASAGLYEYTTHVGRGWLCGEAFYEGRPTSYWRSEIRDWADRFNSPEEAVEYSRFRLSAFLTARPNAPRPTFTTRLREWAGGFIEMPNDNGAPAVLDGYPDADPVLRELEDDPAMHHFVKTARANAGFREMIVKLFQEDAQ